MTGPTERFSHRVSEYALYRPGYPEALFRELPAGLLTPRKIVADIGCGTGIFTARIARAAGTVHAVEPNREMREYAVRSLSLLPNVEVRDGRAESTGLPDASVDVITAAQAFHWFDRAKTRDEFRRILKSDGAVLLVWYERLTTGDDFLEGYERLLLEHSIDYRQVDHRNVTPEIIDDFFRPDPVRFFTVGGEQGMDFAGVRGRVISSSYAPAPDHPAFAPLMSALRELFDRTQRDGLVRFRYHFNAYLCLPRSWG
jgi:SAM-dependent methyltransferase